MKSEYLISCAVVALVSGGAGAAIAADQGAASPVLAAAASSATLAITTTTAAGAASAAVDTSAAPQIIVTAERRSENVERVPMTVQAFTDKALRQTNVATLNDLLKFTPNVTLGSNGPGQGDIFMRGLSAGFRGSQSSSTIAGFPNVAVYLDDQSMQFPARNVDIYVADMQRIEVLEGPQGTLFGGGAEAGAVRYITNKPDFNQVESHIEAGFGVTDGGGPNADTTATVNLPIIPDTLAVRATFYDDHQGGYIKNVPSLFQRSNQDLGNHYFDIKPVGGLCPNGLPAGAAGLCTLANSGTFNNSGLAGNNTNPVDYVGGRFSVRYQIAPDWEALITESVQDLYDHGKSAEYPVGSNFQPLGPLQVTQFEPAYEKDDWENTAWTINGKVGDLHLIYTGGYTDRHIKEQMDYTNYSRSTEGTYYECTGGSTGFGPAGSPGKCFSPLVFWDDAVHNTHLSNEIRVSSPDTWRFRFIVGAFEEQFRIYDVMNFNYKTIPACSAANLTIALAGGQPCLGDVRTAPGSTANDPGIRGDLTAFGEDTQRGYDQTAFFGSVDYDIIPDKLTITLGTRWYDYTEYEVGSQYGTGTGCLDVANGDCGSGNVNINSHHDNVRYQGFKSRANITWRITPDTMVYALFSQGFRPGAFNRSDTKKVLKDAAGVPQFLEPNGYSPDSLDNYEVGLKTQLFDHRLMLNVSAYYMQWQHVQFYLFDPPFNINTTFGINGPSYDVKGVEVQAVARPTDNLTLQGSVSYNDSTESVVPCLTDNIAGTPAFGQCITQALSKVTGLTAFPNPFGVQGAVTAFSPTWQGSALARYDWEMGDYKPYVQADVTYVGQMFNQPASYPSGNGVLIPSTTFLRYNQPAYATLDAAVGVAWGGHWRAELYGSNLTDSHASTFTSSAQFIKSEVPLRPLVAEFKIFADF